MTPEPQLQDGNKLKQSSTLGLVKRLVRDHFVNYPVHIGLALIMMLISAGSKAGLAWLIQPALDDVFISRDSTQLWPISSLVVVLSIVIGVSAYGNRVILALVGQKIIAKIQSLMHAHLMHADMDFHIRLTSGEFVSRLINDMEMLRSALAECFVGLLRSILTVLALVGVMFYNNWLLSLCVFATFPLTTLGMSWVSRYVRRYSTDVQAWTARLSSLMTQSFQGIVQIKLYGEEAAENRRTGAAIKRVLHASGRSIRMGSILRPVTELFGGLAIAIIIFVGGSFVISGELTPGQVFSFLTALIMAYDPMKRIAGLFGQLQRGLAAADRIFEILDMQPKMRDRPNAQTFPNKNRDIVFDKVDFNYSGQDSRLPAIQSLSFTVKAGEMTAIVGESGSGKSTLFSLLPRLYDIDNGEIRIGGLDIRNIHLKSLRAHMAFVSQEAMIFNTSVTDNIRFGSPNASQEDVEAAAKAAVAHDFVINLPEKYDTVLGERGLNLSGGQKQRLMLARALLRDPPFILLDEATSALDSESEKRIQESVNVLQDGTRTILIIAHRLSTIRNANQIIVLDKGTVAEFGTHTELIQQDGIYARLYKLQYGLEKNSEPS